MKKYTKPEINVVNLKTEDIMAPSAVNQIKTKFANVKFGEIDF